MDVMIDSLNAALEGFGLDAHCVKAERHRHFGSFDVKLGAKCRISKLSLLSRELALKIRSRSTPIIKTIPSEGIVRLQVVLDAPELLDFGTFHPEKPKRASLPFILGVSDEGQPVWMDMAQNPHLLIAGETNSGKSVLLHTIVANAAQTENVQLFLSDPKSVEFTVYDDPSLRKLVHNISNTYSETLDMLEYLVGQMEKRYHILSMHKIQKIEDMAFPFARLVCIIDEVSELMLSDHSGKLQTLLVKLAQKGRAAGIYMNLATQRPSVDVLTGLIKANFPARISCRVASRVDSQVILDQPGAEHLLGQGDAIIKNRSFAFTRFQVSYVKPEDTKKRYLQSFN
jgi:S-DNA-T family DNA segregation ATPase FtsK/SpoIIIE